MSSVEKRPDLRTMSDSYVPALLGLQPHQKAGASDTVAACRDIFCDEGYDRHRSRHTKFSRRTEPKSDEAVPADAINREVVGSEDAGVHSIEHEARISPEIHVLYLRLRGASYDSEDDHEKDLFAFFHVSGWLS